jgi:hypothetical protein
MALPIAATLAPAAFLNIEPQAASCFKDICTIIDNEVKSCKELEARNGNEFTMDCFKMNMKSREGQTIKVRKFSIVMNVKSHHELDKKILGLSTKSSLFFHKLRERTAELCRSQFFGDYAEIIRACENNALSTSRLLTQVVLEKMKKFPTT